MTNDHELIGAFHEAALCAEEGLLVDALHKFREIRDADPQGPLADDAQVNLSLCYLYMHQYELANTEFDRVLRDYPDGTIHAPESDGEHGRTAAKALYGKTLCALAIGDVEAAKSSVEELEQFPDSYVMTDGEPVTFHTLANRAVAERNK